MLVDEECSEQRTLSLWYGVQCPGRQLATIKNAERSIGGRARRRLATVSERWYPSAVRERWYPSASCSPRLSPCTVVAWAPVVWSAMPRPPACDYQKTGTVAVSQCFLLPSAFTMYWHRCSFFLIYFFQFHRELNPGRRRYVTPSCHYPTRLMIFTRQL